MEYYWWFVGLCCRVEDKLIGVLYGYSGYIGGLLGFFFSMWIRAELALPGLPVVRKVIEVSVYNHWITVHGLIMLFLFVMPIAIGFYGNRETTKI